MLRTQQSSTVSYQEIKDVLQILDINPITFWLIAGDRVTGWFQDMPERRVVATERMVNIILEGEE